MQSMFRKMRRFKQQLADEEALDVLKEGHLGVLSVLGDDDYPYGLPIDYFCDEDGHLYLHGAKEGHKIDAIARHDKVSFCVMDEGKPDGGFARYVRSVIVFGRIAPVEDHQRVLDAAWKLSMHIYPEQKEFYREDLRKNGDRVQILELVPEQITGKLVHER